MRAARKRDSVMGLTERMTELRDMQRGKNLGRAPTKTLLVGIAFAMAVCFISQAFASEVPDPPNGTWKNGHYVCGQVQTNS
jgi:hypothetical protein